MDEDVLGLGRVTEEEAKRSKPVLVLREGLDDKGAFSGIESSTCRREDKQEGDSAIRRFGCDFTDLTAPLAMFDTLS